MSGRITIGNLSDSLKELINQAGLTEEQVINLINANGLTEEQIINLVKNNLTGDLTQLNTTNKTNIVAAINELFQSANNGKELIANAIGEPLNAEDTFNAMSNDINGLLSTFKTNMMNNGVTVNSGDKFKALIDKIATLSDNEGKGIQFASGQITAQQRYTFANVYATHTFNFNKPLNFTPTYLFIRIPDVRYSSTNGSGEAINAIVSNLFNNIYEGNDWANQFRVGCVSSEGVLNIKSVSTTGFVMEGDTDITFGCATSSDYYGTDGVIDWYAIGVGEEDTTLRDSLASILIDEGVSVTEDDDMASLITKVDEEFDRKIDVKIGSYMYPITMKENVQKITINHNLGKTPSFVNIYIPYTSLYYLYGGYEYPLQTTTTRAMNHIIDSRVYYDTDHCFIVLADSNRYMHAYITDITNTSFSFAMCCGMEGSGYEIHLDSFDWVVM